MTEPKTPKASKDTVYIDAEDDITSIIDKVESAKEKVVALVLPKRSTTLQSIVNMRLLKRSAENAGKNVVLITSEAALIPLAGAAGLHLAKNLNSKPEIPPSPVDVKTSSEIPDEEEIDEGSGKVDYSKPIGELAAVAAMAHDEPETIALDNTEPSEAPKPAKSTKKNKVKVPDFDRFRLLVFGGIGVLIVLIIFLIFATKVLPKAKVTITTSSIPVSANLNLTASDQVKTVDVEKKQIPATLKTSDQTSTQTVQATGQQNNGEKATGSVKLTNCNNGAVTIPAGTGISGSGLTYISQEKSSIDAGNFDSGGHCKTTGSQASTSTVKVSAQTAGAKYNGSHGPYTVAGYSGVTGSDSGGMSGGTDNIVIVISQQDVDNAKAKVTSGTSSDFSKSFQSGLEKDGFYILSSTLKATEPQVSATPGVGQQASSATATIKVTYSVLVVKKDDLKQFLTAALQKQIDKSKQRLSGDVLTKATITVASQPTPSSAELNISEDTSAIPIFSDQDVKNVALGKKTAEIRDTINQWPGVKNVDVKLSPFWVSKAPKSSSKITVVIVESKESNPQ